jgi:ribonuclease HII
MTRLGLPADFEQECFEKRILSVAGVDEVGRGALAGPVVAGAYLIDPETKILEGINDSKKLSAKNRVIKEHELKIATKNWGIGLAGVKEINEVGIVAATLMAMQRAMDELPKSPDLVLIDGFFRPALTTWFPANTLWSEKADATYYCVAAASILAKVYRDRYMMSLAKRYPLYQFNRHKGYGTVDHRRALYRWGITRHHRLHFCTRYTI